MMAQYRFDPNFPSFTYAEAINDMELDFNMLSEYLFVDEESGKVPNWSTSMEDILSEYPRGGMSNMDKDGEGKKIPVAF
jgi:hypothetical protein